jgi:amino acid adenylation domain-containing protein/non-ribosomal peptide synthase protein (TIGR01720 family)
LPSTIPNKKLNNFLEFPLHGDKITNIYTLTPLQKGFLFHNLYEDDKSAYVCQFYCDLKGGFSRESFDKSWMHLMQEHTVLRTAVFGEDLDVPVQCVYDQIPLPIKEIDFRELSKKEVVLAFDTFLIEDKKTGFSLKEAPLFRITLINLGKNLTRLVFTHHHIILDGWSVQNLMKSFQFFYTQLETGVLLPKLALDDFGMHIQHISKINEEDGLAYWSDYLSELTTPSYLPFINDSLLRNKLFGNKKIEFTINGGLRAYAKKNRITENTLLQGVWAFLLSKYTNNENVAFGTIISGRDLNEDNIESKAGLYMNTIPVYSKLRGDMKVSDWLHELQEKHTIAREEYGYLALNKIENQCNIKGSLFDTIMSFQNYFEENETSSSEFDGRLIMENFKGDTNTNYSCTLDVYSSLSKLKIILQYNDQLISDETILKIKGHLETVLTSLLDGAKYIKDLEYLTKEEEDELLNVFNDTSEDYDKEKTVLDLFKEQAILNPTAKALIYETEYLTYKELDERSTLWAMELLNSGVVSESVVALRMTKSFEMITAILSVMKAGCSYMVIDSNLPSARIIHMMNETVCNYILTNVDEQPEGLDSFNWIHTEHLGLQKEKYYHVELPEISVDSLAYILYTSGSTGRPKGCMISHGNLFNFIFWGNNFYYKNLEDGNWGLISSMSFDLSVTVVFTSLTRGKKLFIGNEKKSMDQLLEDCFNNPEIDTLMLTPTHVTILKDIDVQNTNIKTVICGGEQLKKSHIQLIKDINKDITVYNEYGPTETTVGCTATEVSLEDEKITIGRPIANVKIQILDFDRKVVPVGVVGELYISGSGVSKGYINNPLLTEECFVSIDNVICYKTGDLGRWSPEGQIEYAGRVDDQVKIRGYRIQLKEIESVLDSFEGIKQSVVVVREDRVNIKQLVGYVVSEENIDNSSIKRFLELTLPEYMVPKVYLRLPFFPVTNAGKIDVKELPVPDATNNYVAPTIQLEKELVVVWQKLLGVEQIGVHDNFYELGGDSIKAIQLVSRSKSIGIHFQVKDIFNYQTISEIVLHLRKDETIVKETGILEGQLGLHPIQKLFFQRKFKDISHSNQSVLLKISKSITKDALVFAISELVKHHDVLRMSYHKQEDSIHPLQKYDSFLPEIIVDQVSSLKNISETCTRYQADLDIYKGDLMRCVLFETEDDEIQNRLFIAIHHLAVDGISWRILTEDLVNLFESYLSGTIATLPTKGTSYRQWVTQLKTYASSATLESEYLYWKEILSSYMPLPVDKDYHKEITYQETENITEFLTPDLTNVLVHESHRIYGTEINDILISALTMVLSRWINAPNVVIALEGHGREELFDEIDINRTLGWFTSSYPIRLNLDEVDDIDILIADTKDMLRSIPNKGIGYNVLQFDSESEKIKSELSVFYEDITFNYLGDFDNGLDTERENLIGFASEGTGLNVGKQNVNPHKIIIDSSIKEGILQVEWNYDAKRYNKETIQKLANTYIYALETILSHNSELFNPEENQLEQEDFKIVML